MSATTCLKCEKEVLIPAGASLKATVRCPLCDEQFELSELLDELPPPLVVVEDPEAAAVVTRFNFDFDGNEQEEGSPSSADSVEAAESVGATGAAPAFEFDDSSKPEAGGYGEESSAKPLRTTTRPQRKQKSAAVEIAKVIGGGVLGIAIAIVGIWWIAKKDPFKLGPKVSGVAPWIVPEQFRGAGGGRERADDQETDKKNQGNEQTARNQSRRATATQEENDDIGERNFSESPFSSDDQDTTPEATDPAEETTENGSPKVDQSSPQFAGISGVAVSTPAEFQQAVNSATVALTKWAPEEGFDSETFRKDASDAIKLLGLRYATANQQDSANQEAVERTQELLNDLKGKDKKLAILNQWAAEMLSNDEPKVEGILVTGEVESIEKQGLLYESRITLPTEPVQEIAVITTLDPSEFSPPGSQIIVLGALVPDPVTNFASYGGNDDQVICCGRLDLLQKPDKE